jgi:hypothetical protein
MARRRLGLAEERLVPFEAVRNVNYADDRPCALHRISAVGLTTKLSDRRWKLPIGCNSRDSFSRTVRLSERGSGSLQRLVRQ